MGKTRGLQHKGRGFEFGFGDGWWGPNVIRLLKNGPAAVKLMASELDGKMNHCFPHAKNFKINWVVARPEGNKNRAQLLIEVLQFFLTFFRKEIFTIVDNYF